jgi:hypothetical protein
MANRKKKHATESAAPAIGHPRTPVGAQFEGRFEGRGNTLDAAVVVQVSVAFPEPDASEMVLGAVKFWSGAPKEQAGLCAALGGADEMPCVSVTFPVNPFAPVTLMRQEPDCPGEAIMTVLLAQPGDTLMPEEPMFAVTEETALLPE